MIPSALPMPAPPARVLCVGHAAHDAVYRIDVLPPRPTKVRAIGFGQSVGGMAANAARTIAGLGGEAWFHGPIGDDDIGDRVINALRIAGVTTGQVVRVPGARTSHSAIIVQADGERLIISQHGNALAAGADTTPQALDTLRLGDAAGDRAVVLADVRWDAGARAACARARLLGLTSVLDGEMGNPDLLAELVPQFDHVIFSEPGFAEWCTATGYAGDISSALPMLVKQGAKLAAVTQGERGVAWACRDDGGPVTVNHLPAFKVPVVETLGAGDAFHGAYALALAEGQAVADALRFAAASAALRCTRYAAQLNLPTRREVQALLRSAP